MKDLLRPYTESMWRICSVAALVSLVLFCGMGLFFAKEIDALNAAARETDLRPRVRGQRPIPLSIAYDLSIDGTNWVRRTNWNDPDALRQRLERLERRLDEEQNRRQMVPMPLPHWTNGLVPPMGPPMPQPWMTNWINGSNYSIVVPESWLRNSDATGPAAGGGDGRGR